MEYNLEKPQNYGYELGYTKELLYNNLEVSLPIVKGELEKRRSSLKFDVLANIEL
jgi:hypothetical protein